jgi:hypothetical protein
MPNTMHTSSRSESYVTAVHEYPVEIERCLSGIQPINPSYIHIAALLRS